MFKTDMDGIGNHPESLKIKEICDITPLCPETIKICKLLNAFRNNKIKNRLKS